MHDPGALEREPGAARVQFTSASDFLKPVILHSHVLPV